MIAELQALKDELRAAQEGNAALLAVNEHLLAAYTAEVEAHQATKKKLANVRPHHEHSESFAQHQRSARI